MTVLRSREVPSPTTTPKSLKPPTNSIHPSTPSQLQETYSRHSSPLILSHSPNPYPVSGTDSTGMASDSASVPGVIRRRSSRLAAKGHSGEHSAINRVLDNRLEGNALSGLYSAGSTEMKGGGESSDEIDARGSGLASNEKLGVRSVCSGVEVLEVSTERLNERRRSIEFGYTESKSGEAKGKRKLIPEINSPYWEFIGENPESKQGFSLRPGKRVSKTIKQGLNVDVSRRHDNGVESVDEQRRNLKDNENDATARDGNGEVVMKELMEKCPRIDKNDSTNSRSRLSRREKGKWIVNDLNPDGNDAVVLHSEPNFEKLRDNIVDNQGYRSAHEIPMSVENGKDERKTSTARKVDANSNVNDYPAIDESGCANKESGGEKLIVEALLSSSDEVRIESKMICEGSSMAGDGSGTAHLTDSGPENDNRQVMKSSSEEEESSNDEQRRWMFRERFREYARLGARALAQYSDDDESSSSAEAEGEKEIEDWPGPFSTAMKIARDRATKDLRVKKTSLAKNDPAPVLWIPRKRKRHTHNHSELLPPSLQDLCLWILSKNADAIASLDFVPDAFRHRLGRLLCDSRRMNSHFLDLLLCGSPTEVCIRDCSWLDEDEFVKSFQGCDTSKLMILQLDQCGRCIVDYVVLSSLARSSNSLPALKVLSLSGACRLSDIGITALVSSAPALQSINLSQCSFLTSSSINTLANSLGSTLRELYLSDCQNLDPVLMISALKKLEHLEVLSLAGIQNVSDNFIQEFVTANGHNMKELILTDCVKLTDKSIKAISETCSALCAIDLVNLSMLSDYALCCLASGCLALQKLKLSRNLFSDEAVAAFVEISGGNLKELSLNNVKKVSRGTAISLACFSRNLVSLDLSWCRNLTEETLGLIVDNCLSLRVLKLFGCTQVTNKFLDGHSNPDVEIIGLKMSPLWEYVESPDTHHGPS